MQRVAVFKEKIIIIMCNGALSQIVGSSNFHPLEVNNHDDVEVCIVHLTSRAKKIVVCCSKKNMNAPRPSEHPPVRGKKCQNVSHIQRIGCQPEKTTLHGGQSRSWSAEQGKENKRKSLAV